MLAHPLTRGAYVDDPRTTETRHQIILSKPFLRAIYEDWYADVVRFIPPGEGHILELGSGPGFLTERLPELTTADVLRCHGIDLALDGLQLPFRDGCLRGLVMADVPQRTVDEEPCHVRNHCPREAGIRDNEDGNRT